WQETKSLYFLHKNVSVRDATFPGFIIASPSLEPNYYFHWVRDAALVMKSLFKYLSDKEKIVFFDDYAKLVLQHQNTKTNISSLGEVKYKKDGTAYTGPWGRPQNDGPALRSLTLIEYFLYIKSNNLKYSLPDDHFYSLNPKSHAVIKKDLDYIVKVWKEKDYDLWEEVKGDHFFTKMVQAEALLQGMKVANLYGDSISAIKYESTYEEINEFLNKFFNVSQKYFFSTINWSGGHNTKTTYIDTATILAFNQIKHPYNINSNNNFKKVVDTFRNLYKINKNRNEYALGRYPEDFYFGGNPWFLLTAAAGEYIYKMVDRVNRQYKISSSQFPKDFIPGFKIPQTKQFSPEQKNQLLQALFSYGDEFLKTIQKHVDLNSGRMDEQFHRDNGYMLSAKHLTWSYSAFLSMKKARDKAQVIIQIK
ncbi:glycoside hydrolase family 15 protein, partial [Bacteriovoracaceae bacterium]|nr:glycoside hydrolase family 15 protein [Bacteriovoracaceae bacterium]